MDPPRWAAACRVLADKYFPHAEVVDPLVPNGRHASREPPIGCHAPQTLFPGRFAAPIESSVESIPHVSGHNVQDVSRKAGFVESNVACGDLVL